MRTASSNLYIDRLLEVEHLLQASARRMVDEEPAHKRFELSEAVRRAIGIARNGIMLASLADDPVNAPVREDLLRRLHQQFREIA